MSGNSKNSENLGLCWVKKNSHILILSSSLQLEDPPKGIGQDKRKMLSASQMFGLVVFRGVPICDVLGVAHRMAVLDALDASV